MAGFGFPEGNDTLIFAPFCRCAEKLYSFISLETLGKNKISQGHSYYPLASPLVHQSWYGLWAFCRAHLALLCLPNYLQNPVGWHFLNFKQNQRRHMNCVAIFRHILVVICHLLLSFPSLLFLGERW